MQPTLTTTAQHMQLTELMQSLTNIQMRMSRVKNTFPNYYGQLQQTYSQLLLKAKQENILPPWMKM